MTFGALSPAWPEILLALAAMALLMVGVFHKDGARAARLVSWLGVAALVVVAVVVVSVTPEEGRTFLFANMFAAGVYTAFVKVLVLGAAAVGIILSVGYNAREQIARFEYPVLIMVATLGMMVMISANDLISLYVGLELQSLSLYVVAAFRRDSIKSSEAGLKYFILGALASGMLLYGASMVYGFTGTTNFTQLATVFGQAGAASVGAVVGLVFVMVGLAFKVSAVPFHMWTPDVYEGAPTPVTAFFASAPKLAAMALFVSVMVGPFGKLIGEWQQIMVLISILSMALGAFAAIQQTNIKRLLAYSSIGHVGYALIGLAAGTKDGVTGILVYMAIYIVMTLGTFAVVLCMQRDGRMVEDIKELSGLSRTRPGMALLMGIFMFSMAGLPPLAGFFAKVYVFLAAIEAKLYTLAILGVLASVVGAFYYLRIVKIMYFDEATESFDRNTGRELTAIQVVAGLFILLFFLFPSVLTGLADQAVLSLMGG
jgi:NADH-quinone oxidoreductase subunit N